MLRPKDVVCMWVDAFNQHDADAIAALYHDEAVNHQVANEPVEGAAAIREILGLRPIREFDQWMERMGLSENGKLTSRAGDPTIFLEKGGRG